MEVDNRNCEQGSMENYECQFFDVISCKTTLLRKAALFRSSGDPYRLRKVYRNGVSPQKHNVETQSMFEANLMKLLGVLFS